MPKRSYPFGDCSPLQLKTHVGTKQLCGGVAGEQYKRDVFEKTKKLLFSGAQAFMGSMWSGSKAVIGAIPHSPDHGAENEAAPPAGVNGLIHGQTLISLDGKLLKSSSAREKPSLPMSVSKACSSCVKSVGAKEACAQCDRYICQNCSVRCCCCNAVTCSMCSVFEDGDLCEKAFCYNCSLFEVSR
ncbi:apoptosis regulatory protein Siva [Ambystoma mexicanum]|uniref:apoptosis regulatory protein Siva n=1 Tax=Ambystoma mexicanum TaxID=8296 RepID=UPI0037E94314